jgi:acyl transferase domain-containing protein
MVGRASYSLGLVGPCVGLDTACSSSLVTTHLAHRALLDGEATTAVTAGVNVMFSPLITAAICQLQARACPAWQNGLRDRLRLCARVTAG